MATSLLDWIINLMRDNEAREAFNANPHGAMASAGFSNVCGEDVADSRTFLFDNPSIRQVEGVQLPQTMPAGADAPATIHYIVNNYTFEIPAVAGASDVDGANAVTDVDADTTNNEGDTTNTIFDVPGEGPDIDQSGNDGGTNTATASDDDTTTDSSTTMSNAESTTTDSSTTTSSDDDTDQELSIASEAKNIVPGDNSAGEDQIEGNTLDVPGQAILGDDNTSILTLTDTVDIDDIEVLNVADDLLSESTFLNNSPILNGSPILNDLLDDSVNDSVDDLIHDLL